MCLHSAHTWAHSCQHILRLRIHQQGRYAHAYATINSRFVKQGAAWSMC